MPGNVTAETPVQPNTAAPQQNAQPAPQQPATDYRALYEQTQKQLADLQARSQKLEADTKDAPTWREKAAALEKLQQERIRNPLRVVETLFGKNWHDDLGKLKTGGVTPELVGTQISEAQTATETRLKSLEASLTKQIEELRLAQVEREREDAHRQARGYAESNKDKFPLIHHFGVLDTLGPMIEQHAELTRRAGKPELWTPEQAAIEVEKYYATMLEKAKEYLGRSNPSAPPGPGQQPRLSVIPDPKEAQKEPLTDDERMQRAFAAWNAVKAAQQKAVN